MRPGRCRWKCGQVTKNISQICDSCWVRREEFRAERTATEAARKARPWRELREWPSLSSKLPVTELSGASDG